MSAIEKVANYDFSVIILAFMVLFSICFAVMEILKLKDFFKQRWRVKTGKESDEETIEDRIATLEKHDKWQYSEISKISEGILDIKKQLLDKKIDDWRWEILDFASALSAGRSFSKEQFVHVFRTEEQYERILEENKLQNGQVADSLEIIHDIYKEKLKNGFEAEISRELSVH